MLGEMFHKEEVNIVNQNQQVRAVLCIDGRRVWFDSLMFFSHLTSFFFFLMSLSTLSPFCGTKNAFFVFLPST
jgi:hypothetical protein